MATTLTKLPRYLTDAGQGLAFWMGYQRARFHGHHITEGAVVLEFCNLLQAQLDGSLFIRREVMYRHLASTTKELPPKFDGVLADLVLYGRESRALAKDAAAEHARLIVEVKLASAPTQEIRDDVERLLAITQANVSKPRGVLVIASEAGTGRRQRRELVEDNLLRRWPVKHVASISMTDTGDSAKASQSVTMKNHCRNSSRESGRRSAICGSSAQTVTE